LKKAKNGKKRLKKTWKTENKTKNTIIAGAQRKVIWVSNEREFSPLSNGINKSRGNNCRLLVIVQKLKKSKKNIKIPFFAYLQSFYTCFKPRNGFCIADLV